MPDTHDETIENLNAADAEGAVRAEIVDAELVVDAVEVDAEIVDAEVDAEVVDAEAADEDDSAEGKRPSVHGRRAKPRKGKEGGSKSKPKRERKPISAKLVRRILLGSIVFVLVAALVGAGLFCWQKWMRFDDAADIQGVWKVQSTGDTIVFDAHKLKLTRGISYEYTLDKDEKTISYTFADLEGGGHYYFSGGRDMLVIIDGDEQLGMLAEAGFLPASLVEQDDPNDNKTVLAKVSDDTSAQPSGTATGVSAIGPTGEREYVMNPEPEPSTSSSTEKKKSRSSDESEESDEESSERDSDEHTGFVDEDGDGYDDVTGLDYEEFYESQENPDGSEGESEDGSEDESEDASEENPEGEEYLDEGLEDESYDDEGLADGGEYE